MSNAMILTYTDEIGVLGRKKTELQTHGVIVPAEIKELHDYGVARIYSPEDGATMGLQGMIDDMLTRANQDLCAELPSWLDNLSTQNQRHTNTHLATGSRTGR